MASHLDPATFTRSILLEASDIPADMTIAQWRTQRAAGAVVGRGGRRWHRRRRSVARDLLPRSAAPNAFRPFGRNV